MYIYVRVNLYHMGPTVLKISALAVTLENTSHHFSCYRCSVIDKYLQLITPFTIIDTTRITLKTLFHTKRKTKKIKWQNTGSYPASKVLYLYIIASVNIQIFIFVSRNRHMMSKYIQLTMQ